MHRLALIVCVQEIIYLTHGKQVAINARDPDKDYMTALHLAAVYSRGAQSLHLFVCAGVRVRACARFKCMHGCIFVCTYGEFVLCTCLVCCCTDVESTRACMHCALI